MRRLPFKASAKGSIGIELEFQIIDPVTYGTISRAKELIRSISEKPFHKNIKPEITQSMIELNSSIHQSPTKLYEELNEMRNFLCEQSDELGIKLSGGGSHPFQNWSLQKIFPTIRFKNLSHRFTYLAKQSTVFGQHIHIGCQNSDDAIYLTHALTRYVPQLIAINAASPYFQGVDTGFQSSRLNEFNAFPLSGVIPYLINWSEFSNYFYKMKKLKIIKTMKDFYWDIRPKPEFGTVEIRVCDTPLTIKTAVIITAYIQALSLYLLSKKPFKITPELYYLYGFNRFQAARYGFDGEFIDPSNLERTLIYKDILSTLQTIEKYFIEKESSNWFQQLHDVVTNKQNDATRQRQIFKDKKSLAELVHEQCLIWEKE